MIFFLTVTDSEILIVYSNTIKVRFPQKMKEVILMKKFRKTTSLFLALCLVLALPVRAWAETYFLEDGSVVVSTDATDQYVAQGGGEAQKQTSDTIITQRDNAQATSNTITIDTSAQDAKTAEITIQDVNIATPETGIEVGASDVVIHVEGDKNQVTSTGRVNSGDVYEAPIHVSSGDLTITGSSDDTLKVTVSPSSDSASGQAAAIGSNSWESGGYTGSITVTGDLTLEATSKQGAGIGTGFSVDMNGGSISIEGGNVTAEGGVGIGVGTDLKDGTIEISGGTVNATGDYAGIGTGISMTGGSIIISGGDVTAAVSTNSNKIGPGIGPNASYGGGSIEISGGTVTAQGGTSSDGLNGSAGIGSGSANSMGTPITISGGIVTAIGGANAAGIGTGSGYGWPMSGDIEISGDAQIIAQAGEATLPYPPNAIGNGGDRNEITWKDGYVIITDNAQVTLPQNGTLLSDAIVSGSAAVTQTSEDWQTVRDAILAAQNKPAPAPQPPVPSVTEEETTESTLWDTILRNIRQASEGSELTIQVYDNTQIPRSLLELARERNITLVIQWDGGEDIRLAPDADIDLTDWFIPLKDL